MSDDTEDGPTARQQILSRRGLLYLLTGGNVLLLAGLAAFGRPDQGTSLFGYGEGGYGNGAYGL